MTALSIFLLFVLFFPTTTTLAGTDGRWGGDGGGEYYYKNWCGTGLQYLDDAKCAKLFPSLPSTGLVDRNWQCTVPVLEDATKVPQGYFADDDMTNVVIDTESLAHVVTNGANLCLISTIRVAAPERDIGVRLYNKYFCAGNYSASEVWETWSSSKIFAAANAAGHLRTLEPTSSCPPETAGLDSLTVGKDGSTSLGDLVTIICSYDHTAGYTSNSLASYMHDFGWRSRIHNLVGGSWAWPGTHGALPGLTLGGNYGEPSPSDLSMQLKTDSGVSCGAQKDNTTTLYSNSLSALAAAEMTRRIVQHREANEATRFPGAEWQDVQNILLGAETSGLFPGELWGGMSADTAIFLQSALSAAGVDPEAEDGSVAPGQWRIFSKLGAGYSTSRSRGEIVSNAYACLPVREEELELDAMKANQKTRQSADAGLLKGVEFTMSVRGSVPNDSFLLQVQAQVLEAVKQAIGALVRGDLAI